MKYEMINEELRIARCSLADLTLEQVKHFLGQWEPGSNIGNLILFYEKEDDVIVLNSSNKKYQVLDKRERDVLKRELRADAKDTLTSQGLPSTLADLIDYSDKESSEKSLENVISIFREATAQGIKNALRGHAPRVGARLPGKDPIADAFAKKAR